MKRLFADIMRTEYTIDECGIKVPYSDFDRPPEYYAELRKRTYTGDEYADMCMLKDRGTALYDKRWKSAKAVIDFIAKEIEIDPEGCGMYLYGLMQSRGEFSSPLVDKMRAWFDKSGDKVKMKRRIAELEAQLSALQAAIRGE
jgi:hypothetical protein